MTTHQHEQPASEPPMWTIGQPPSRTAMRRSRMDSPVDSTGQNAPAPLLYTPEQAAALLQVPASWLRKKASARTIPCTFVGKHLRFSQADLVAIITAAAQPAR